MSDRRLAHRVAREVETHIEELVAALGALALHRGVRPRLEARRARRLADVELRARRTARAIATP